MRSRLWREGGIGRGVAKISSLPSRAAPPKSEGGSDDLTSRPLMNLMLNNENPGTMVRTLARTLKSWFSMLRGRPASSLLAVDWDETTVRIRVLDKLEPFWNQEFRWPDITRVCFKDEGVFASDIVFLEVAGHDNPVCILTEARQGPDFMAELFGRGLFPWDVLKKAVSSTNGGMICWPPRDR
jgi:hypothetical protein